MICPLCAAITAITHKPSICKHAFKKPEHRPQKPWKDLTGSEWVERCESMEWEEFFSVPDRTIRRKKVEI